MLDDSMLRILIILLIICFVIYFVRMIVSVIKTRKIEDFAIKRSNGKLSIEYNFFNIVHLFSSFIKKMIVFNAVAHSYDKYVVKDNKNFREGMDFIALKILLGILFVCLYFASNILFFKNCDSLLGVICFLVGFLIVDVVLSFWYEKRRKVILNDILKAIIIMNNGFKANKSMEQVLEDVIFRLDGPIKDEFIRIINDIKLGMNVSTAFMRMYKRVELPLVCDIANILALVNVSGASNVLLFEMIEKRIVEEEKVISNIKHLDSFNKMFALVFLLLPIFMVLILFMMNYEYYKLIIGAKGYMVIISLLVVYVIYFIFVRRVVRGRYR